jgi:hypothetical protein
MRNNSGRNAFSFVVIPATVDIMHATPYLILPAALGPGVYSASNRNEYQKHKIIMFLRSKVRRVRRADNLIAIYEPIV